MPLLAHIQTHLHTHTHTHTHTATCNNNSFLVANNNERKFYFEWFQLTHYMCACKWEVNATALFVLVVPTMCVCSCYMCSRTDKIFSSLSRNSHTHWFGFSRNCSFRLTDLRATYLLTTFMQFLLSFTCQWFRLRYLLCYYSSLDYFNWWHSLFLLHFLIKVL
jgi:hypothetical protein